MSFIFGRFHPSTQPLDSTTPLPTAPSAGKRWRCGAVALGYCPVVAHDSDAYPLHDSDSGLSITASLRLDNRAELCRKLAIPHKLAAHLSDGQLLLRAYQMWGSECPHHLLGDFAFVIWNAKEHTLFAARDFIGTRPFYYAASPQRFLFASSASALLTTPSVSDQLDLPFLGAYYRHGQNYPHPTRTFYKAIRKLAPGHALLVNRDNVHCWRYWFPEHLAEIDYRREESYTAHLRELLTDAVHARLPADGPVGAHLSGGLDCTSVSVLANRAMRAADRGLYGYCWSPPISQDRPLLRDDERCAVEEIGSAEQIPVVYVKAEPVDVVALRFRHLVNAHDGWFMHELPVRRHAVANGVSTILSGWGGDEFITFNGRGYLAKLLRQGNLPRLIRTLAARRKRGGKSIRETLLYQTVLPLLPDALRERGVFRGGRLAWEPQPLPTLFDPAFSAELQQTALLPDKSQRFEVGVRATQLALWRYGHLTERIEGWAAAGLRNSVTYAYPMLDKRLVEFAFQLPPDAYIKHGWTRYLFRTAVDKVLPRTVVWRNAKREPAIKAEKQALRQQARKLWLKLAAQLLDQTDICQILDLAGARRTVNAKLATPPQSGGDVMSAIQVEQLINPTFAASIEAQIQNYKRLP